MMGVSSRQVTDMCVQGKFPGAYKDKTPQKKWHIPKEAALAVLAEREAPVEVLPPEGLEVIPHETARAFVLGIVKEELLEELKKNSEEIMALQKKVAELEDRLASEAKKKSEEVAEVKELVERHDRELMQKMHELQEAQKKKPGLVARVVKRLFG